MSDVDNMIKTAINGCVSQISGQMTKESGLLIMRRSFPEHQISLLPRPTKKDNPKGKCDVCGGFHGLPAVHLKYVGHAALTDRLLDADPCWSWEPLSIKDGLPQFDANGGLWIKLTVCGVTRLGYGNAEGSDFKDVGAREKEVIGDALRNAAMRFGAALELWHKGSLHIDEADSQPTQSKTHQQEVKQELQNLINHAPGSSMKSQDPIIKIGKNKGKRYTEIPLHELSSMADWLKNDAAKKKQPVSKMGLEFIAEVLKLQEKNHADEFNQLPEPPPDFPPPPNDEIPF